MRAARDAGRVLALAMMILILASTAWVCMIAAAVVLLSRWIGTGLALLAVAGALVFLLAIILAVASAMRRSAPPPPGLMQRVLPSALAQGALGVLSHPLVIRAGLLLIGVLFALSSVLLPGRTPKDRDPPS